MEAEVYDLVKSLRQDHGAKFAMITGARSSTALARLLQLPAVDAVGMEEGGRILFRDETALTALPYVEDFEWRSRHDPVAGPSNQAHLDPTRRSGELWAAYAKLQKEGWQVDGQCATDSHTHPSFA